MDRNDWLAEQFVAYRIRMRSVAYRMLGLLNEADNAVQESWLHSSRSDTTGRNHAHGPSSTGYVFFYKRAST